MERVCLRDARALLSLSSNTQLHHQFSAYFSPPGVSRRDWGIPCDTPPHRNFGPPLKRLPFLCFLLTPVYDPLLRGLWNWNSRYAERPIAISEPVTNACPLFISAQLTTSKPAHQSFRSSPNKSSWRHVTTPAKSRESRCACGCPLCAGE